MNGIVKILMERDGMTEEEAQRTFDGAKEEFDRCIDEGDMDAAEVVLLDWFGLEADYLFDFIG